MTFVSELLALAVPVVVAGTQPNVDAREIEHEFAPVAAEAQQARELGLGLGSAVHDPRFPELCRFHQDLRDALFVEIPAEERPWIEDIARGTTPGASRGLAQLGFGLTSAARTTEDDPIRSRQQALAELLVFESVRLGLLVTALDSPEYETLGGEESDIDAIAWQEVETLLYEPLLAGPGVRPLPVMFASATVALARDAAERADELRRSHEELREQLRMRAKLRHALRELRLAEAVLLENALSPLLGEERVELPELQAQRPVALDGLSRQAMDQRVSRGRRALQSDRERWPRRRQPALFDVFRERDDG